MTEALLQLQNGRIAGLQNGGIGFFLPRDSAILQWPERM
jgi:hypothetical protein